MKNMYVYLQSSTQNTKRSQSPHLKKNHTNLTYYLNSLVVVGEHMSSFCTALFCAQKYMYQKKLLNKEVRWAYFHVDFDNIPPTVISDTTTKGSKSRRDCTYDGKKYSHGEIFASNSSGIVPTSNKQCVDCACTVSFF